MAARPSRHQIGREAKAIVALAFRNGLIEQLHAGRPCPTCLEHDEVSRITDHEMKAIMKNAVNQAYSLLLLKTESPNEYERRFTSERDMRPIGTSLTSRQFATVQHRTPALR